MAQDEHDNPQAAQIDAGLRLDTAVQYAPGVGPRRAELFAKLEINTIADLVKHLPHRYEYQTGEALIASLPIGAVGTARGMVMNCRWVPGRGSPIGRTSGGHGPNGRFTATVRDDSGSLDLVFFNASWLRDKVHPGITVLVTGKVVVYNDGRQMANPRLQVVGEEDTQPAADEKYRPVYSATEDLPTGQIERVVERVLPAVLSQIEDHFTAEYRAERRLPELREAYRVLHSPADEDQVRIARRRLAYDELLLLQLGFAVKRKHTRTQLTAPPLRYSEAIDKHIRVRFPFALTEAQDAVIKQISSDLQRSIPMNRLLQGDVGSGKTVVALYAMLLAVSSEKQAALMAPTELLAEQHFLSISRMLRESNVRIALLTGSLTRPERSTMTRRIEAGEIDLVIGTHAIVSESIQFSDLGVVVIDEQHRFGVVQRALIRSKSGGADRVPHTLVMTATPIPRTLSLTIFGDLDTSTITQLPPGRQPIVTKLVGDEKSDEVYKYAAKRIAAGEQAYVVLPSIEESAANLKAVNSHVELLRRTHFAGRIVEAVHGQLKRLGREKVMQRFRQGKIDVLVATTVIEVGVDVPNASLMIVEHAERFGLAQLHQLRGRVGRGTRKSLCVFIADPTTDGGRARLEAIVGTTDGFKIAEADLTIRGTGELVGTRQSGLSTLRVAQLPEHMDLLMLARRDAEALIEKDPRLSAPDHALLRARLLKQYGEVLGLADVA
jgi:ATP-dependent DNA helicase RecG